uniref:Uncharacterized protein n=1 Tax=viral metagenome TaxID=1070528 RepID=A0A6M3LK92_9ZZZZ
MTQCEERVSNDSFCSPYRRCTRQGKVFRSGQWYCRQHDPVARDALLVAVMEASRKEWADREAAKAQRQRYERIGRLVCEHREALECYKDVACLPVEAPTLKVALEAILREVEA